MRAPTAAPATHQVSVGAIATTPNRAARTALKNSGSRRLPSSQLAAEFPLMRGRFGLLRLAYRGRPCAPDSRRKSRPLADDKSPALGEHAFAD
jgi:hypothetical protein